MSERVGVCSHCDELREQLADYHKMLRCSAGHVHNQEYGKPCPICERDELRSQIQRERENTDRLAEALEIVSGCYVRCRCGALVCKRCKDDQDVDYALKALAQHAALRSGE